MGSTRKEFLAAAAIAASTATVAQAETIAKADPAPSPAAIEFANRMRRFDPSLTPKQLHDIAKSNDDTWKVGAKVHKGLENGDPMSPFFEIGE
ncbi:MAG TPA: hypothetical protein VGG22_03200 [Candidatus Baltobacteraceae bacterium]|jgi:hypothetical protein